MQYKEYKEFFITKTSFYNLSLKYNISIQDLENLFKDTGLKPKHTNL